METRRGNAGWRWLLATLILASAGDRLLAAPASPPVQTPAAKCAAPEYRQLDFWVGDWEAYDPDEHKVVGRNRVDLILDRCVLREVYDQTDGLSGQSFSLYDAARKVWHQTWVTNSGKLLMLDGKLQGNRLVLEGIQTGADGHPMTVRAVWYPEKDGVRETAAASSDGGKTWKPLFDLLFRPHKAG